MKKVIDISYIISYLVASYSYFIANIISYVTLCKGKAKYHNKPQHRAYQLW